MDIVAFLYQVRDVQAGHLRRSQHSRWRRTTNLPASEVRRQRVVSQQRTHETCETAYNCLATAVELGSRSG